MKRTITALTLVISLAACSIESAPLVASDVHIMRPIPGASATAGYLSLTNTTGQPITITRVASPQFASVEMHESAIEDGISRMYPLAQVTVLPGQSVDFRRGGKHLMLRNPVNEFESVRLQFHAGIALVLTVDAAVED